MQLPNIKDLRELLKLLRNQGVLQYQTPELTLVLNEHLPTTSNKSQAVNIIEEQELSPEEEAERILFYSATSPADNLPE